MARFNKSRGEDEQVKGVPGVTEVKVVTYTCPDPTDPNDRAADDLSNGQVNPGKKRLIAYVGPPTNKVVERVHAECHRKLAGSGMMPYWIKAMPQQTSVASYEKMEQIECQKFADKSIREIKEENPNVAVIAAQNAFNGGNAPTEADHASHERVYKATGYWPGSMGPVQLYISEIEDADVEDPSQEQTFMDATQPGPTFKPWAEPVSSATVLQLKALLYQTPFQTVEGQTVRRKITNITVDQMELVYMGRGEEYGDQLGQIESIKATVIMGEERQEFPSVELVLFTSFVGFTKKSIENSSFNRVNRSIKLESARSGPGVEGAGHSSSHGTEFFIANDDMLMVFEARDENVRNAWVDKLELAIQVGTRGIAYNAGHHYGSQWPLGLTLMSGARRIVFRRTRKTAAARLPPSATIVSGWSSKTRARWVTSSSTRATASRSVAVPRTNSIR